MKALLSIAALLGSAVLLTPKDDSSGDWKLDTPRPAPGEHAGHIDSFAQSPCFACHRAVTEEWGGTLHAASWIDELYQDALSKTKKPEACHGCHVPSTMFGLVPGAAPERRQTDLHFGVRCEACHQSLEGALEGEVLGPRGARTAAHPTRQHAAFSAPGSNALCAACHRVTIGPVIGIAKDFELSGQAAKQKSCVGCHMAPIERRWANLPDGGEDQSVEPRVGRSHALQSPRDPSFLRRAFALSVRRGAASTTLTISNQAGHRVGGLLERRIEFQVTLKRADQSLLVEERRTIDSKSYLPVGGELAVPFEVRADVVEVVGRLFDARLGARAETGLEFLRERFEPR